MFAWARVARVLTVVGRAVAPRAVARTAGPCLLQTATQYVCSDTLGDPQPMDPGDCCAACAKAPDCQSWTVFASQQSTQCSLYRLAGADQQAKIKTGDARYTSGYLPATDHPHADDGAGGRGIAETFLISMGAMAAVYLVIGAAVQWTRNGNQLELPNHAFWVSLGGLVIDGVGFTGQLLGLRDSPGVSTATAGHEDGDGTGDDGLEEGLLGGAKAGGVAKQASRGTGSAWHQAAMLGNAQKLKGLIDRGPATSSELDAGDNRRYTPFHLACSGGHQECVVMLLSAGCDPSLCNDTGRTGRELAEELRRMDVLKYLQGWGGEADAKGMSAAAAATAATGGQGQSAGRRARRKSSPLAAGASGSGSGGSRKQRRPSEGAVVGSGDAKEKRKKKEKKSGKSSSGGRKRSNSEGVEKASAKLLGDRVVQL